MKRELNWKIITFILLNIYAVALFVILINLNNNIKKLDKGIDNNTYIKTVQLYNSNGLAEYDLMVSWQNEKIVIIKNTKLNSSYHFYGEETIKEIKDKLAYKEISYENFEKINGIMYNVIIEFMI